MAGQKDVAVPDADVLVPTLSCDLLLCAFECDRPPGVLPTSPRR